MFGSETTSAPEQCLTVGHLDGLFSASNEPRATLSTLSKYRLASVCVATSCKLEPLDTGRRRSPGFHSRQRISSLHYNSTTPKLRTI